MLKHTRERDQAAPCSSSPYFPAYFLCRRGSLVSWSCMCLLNLSTIFFIKSKTMSGVKNPVTRQENTQKQTWLIYPCAGSEQMLNYANLTPKHGETSSLQSNPSTSLYPSFSPKCTRKAPFTPPRPEILYFLSAILSVRTHTHTHTHTHACGGGQQQQDTQARQ